MIRNLDEHFKYELQVKDLVLTNSWLKLSILAKKRVRTVLNNDLGLITVNIQIVYTLYHSVMWLKLTQLQIILDNLSIFCGSMNTVKSGGSSISKPFSHI